MYSIKNWRHLLIQFLQNILMLHEKSIFSVIMRHKNVKLGKLEGHLIIAIHEIFIEYYEEMEELRRVIGR